MGPAGVSDEKGTALRIEAADRKRLLVATAATVLALPLLVRENRAQQGERPDAVAAVAPGVDLAGPLRGGGTTRDPAPAAAPTPAATAPPTTVAPIDIATPVTMSTSTVTGRASYKRLTTSPGPRLCATALAPRGTTIHVLDLDNGHEVTCTNVLQRAPANGEKVLLDTTTFKELADLAQAPIPIIVSW